MHRAGTQDLKLRKEVSLGWIVSMTILIGKGFKTVNYGKLFEHFFEVCQELTTLGYDVHFKFPRFYSETTPASEKTTQAWSEHSVRLWRSSNLVHLRTRLNPRRSQAS